MPLFVDQLGPGIKKLLDGIPDREQDRFLKIIAESVIVKSLAEEVHSDGTRINWDDKSIVWIERTLLINQDGEELEFQVSLDAMVTSMGGELPFRDLPPNAQITVWYDTDRGVAVKVRVGGGWGIRNWYSILAAFIGGILTTISLWLKRISDRRRLTASIFRHHVTVITVSLTAWMLYGCCACLVLQITPTWFSKWRPHSQYEIAWFLEIVIASGVSGALIGTILESMRWLWIGSAVLWRKVSNAR
jgi:hypothetical protein